MLKIVVRLVFKTRVEFTIFSNCSDYLSGCLRILLDIFYISNLSFEHSLEVIVYTLKDGGPVAL